MKRVRRVVLMGLVLALCFGFSNFLYSETVKFTGDVTTPQTFHGDLIIVDGDVNISSAGDLVVNGDLKITAGKIFMGPSAGKLKVRGDLIVTNTLPGGDASINTHSDIEVTGEIIIKSTYGDANISTTGSSSAGQITAGSIITNGDGRADVYARERISVFGEIDTKSETDAASVVTSLDDIYAGSIVTNGYLGSGIRAPSGVWVLGEVNTFSRDLDATIVSYHFIYAGTITTSAERDAYVYVQNVGEYSLRYIDVKGSINTHGLWGKAYVQVVRGDANEANIFAGSIITDGYGDSYVKSDDNITVRGDIITRSDNSFAYVYAVNGFLSAVNVKTYGWLSAYVKAKTEIDVWREINTHSSESYADVDCTSFGQDPKNGDIKAYRITTYGYTSAKVQSVHGSILVKGPIVTRSIIANADVTTFYPSQSIEAESIFTHADQNAYVKSVGDIKVKDMIKTKSDNSRAYVEAAYDITARSIETNAGSSDDGYVITHAGDITVDGDIRTKATLGKSYVSALNGDITARSIQTISDQGNEDWIAAEAGTARFQFFPYTSDLALTMSNCDIYFDTDHEWNTQLTFGGTCTVNGNDHQLVFGPNGAIIIAPEGSLTLKNINLDKIGGIAVRCQDDSAELYLKNVTWTLTSDFIFPKGLLKIFGDFVVNGPGTSFIYTADQTAQIDKNSTFLLTHGVTFSYDTDTNQRLAMVDDSSRFGFDGGSLHSVENIEFTKGTLVFDNLTTFSVESGKRIDFGDGNIANNIGLEFHLRSQFSIYGWLENNNVLV